MSSDEVVAKIMAVAYDEHLDAYAVQFWVGKELGETPTLNETLALLGNMDALQRHVYTFVVRWEADEFTMEPDEELSECLAIFDKYDSATDVGESFAKQWKTGQVAEAIVAHLVNANAFGLWRTVSDEEIDGPTLPLETETIIDRGEERSEHANDETAETEPGAENIDLSQRKIS